MGYVKDIFELMDLLQIRAFLLYGAKDFIEKPQTYEKRLKTGSGHKTYSLWNKVCYSIGCS